MTGNGFVGHNLDCTSALAVGRYDPNCPRCGAIKKVISLRRKTEENGASLEEETSAQTISDALVTKYNLTRGEVYDRVYAPPPTLQTYKEDIVWSDRKKRKRGQIYNPEDLS